jgi:hypothetical protein
MNRRRRYLPIVAFAILGIALLAIGGEFLYRQRLARQPFHVADLHYYKHARVERALVRNADYRGVAHINKHGFRGADFDIAKAPGTTRVFVLGASTTFDPCVSNDAETWPARMEFWLNERAPDRKFQVINAGIPNYPLVDQVIRLHTELYRFSPDVIMLYANHGIVTAADMPSPPTNSRTPTLLQTFPAWMRGCVATRASTDVSILKNAPRLNPDTHH